MKACSSKGVSKPSLHRRRRPHLPPDFITRWNSSLSIGSPTRPPRQSSILHFVTNSSQAQTHSASSSQHEQESGLCENLEELPEDIPLLQQVIQHADPEFQEKLLSLSPKQNLATIPDSKFGNQMVQNLNQSYVGRKTENEYLSLEHRINPQFLHHLKMEMSELTLMAGGKSTSSVHGTVCYHLFQQLKRFQPNTEKPGLVQ